MKTTSFCFLEVLIFKKLPILHTVSTASSAACTFIKFASHSISIHPLQLPANSNLGQGLSVKSKEILIGLQDKQTRADLLLQAYERLATVSAAEKAQQQTLKM